MKDWNERILSAAVDSIFVIIFEAVLTGSAAAFLGHALTLALKWHGQVVFNVVMAAGILTSAVILVLLLVVRQARVVAPLAKAEYKFTKRTITIDYTDVQRPVYKRRYELKSTSDNLERITDIYAWTGDAAQLPTCTLGDCEVRDAGRCGVFNMFDMVFPYKLKRGKTKIIELIWNLDNSSRSARPFISTGITHPTGRLEMEAIIPEAVIKPGGILVESPYINTQVSSDNTDVNFDHGKFAVSIGRPKIAAHYELRWKWA